MTGAELIFTICFMAHIGDVGTDCQRVHLQLEQSIEGCRVGAPAIIADWFSKHPSSLSFAHYAPVKWTCYPPGEAPDIHDKSDI